MLGATSATKKSLHHHCSYTRADASQGPSPEKRMPTGRDARIPALRPWLCHHRKVSSKNRRSRYGRKFLSHSGAANPHAMLSWQPCRCQCWQEAEERMVSMHQQDVHSRQR